MKLENTPTVTSRSVPAASPSLLGRFFACFVRFFVMWYLSSYLRNVSLWRRSST